MGYDLLGRNLLLEGADLFLEELAPNWKCRQRSKCQSGFPICVPLCVLGFFCLIMIIIIIIDTLDYSVVLNYIL